MKWKQIIILCNMNYKGFEGNMNSIQIILVPVIVVLIISIIGNTREEQYTDKGINTKCLPESNCSEIKDSRHEPVPQQHDYPTTESNTNCKEKDNSNNFTKGSPKSIIHIQLFFSSKI